MDVSTHLNLTCRCTENIFILKLSNQLFIQMCTTISKIHGTNTYINTTNCAVLCMSHEQRCNQKLQGVLRVHFAFMYLRFKIFMCAIHQIGYVRFSGVKYVLFVCKMHLLVFFALFRSK